MTLVSPEILSEKPGTSLRVKDPPLRVFCAIRRKVQKCKKKVQKALKGLQKYCWLVAMPIGSCQPGPLCGRHRNSAINAPSNQTLHSYSCVPGGAILRGVSSWTGPPTAAPDPGKHPPSQQDSVNQGLTALSYYLLHYSLSLITSCA